MRRALLLLGLVGLLVAAPARAQDMSPNVESVASLPELRSAIAVNFSDTRMFVSTATGLFSYDITDPASPQLLAALPMYIWENEDMDVDVARQRIFISRDPRGFTTPATPGSAFPYGAVHVIDISNIHTLEQIGFFTLPAGHTSTCVNGCDFLWTAGPGANAQVQPPDFVGRPVYATDVTDPANPIACPDPIDVGRNDGITDYAHDVQVDERGVAWVSGAGGVRGYWTSGSHRNPLTGAVETATGCKPIPYAGSGTPEGATPSRFMHNAWREPGPAAAAARAASVGSPSRLAVASARRCSTRRGSRAARRRCAAQRRCLRRAKTRRARRRCTAKPPRRRAPAAPPVAGLLPPPPATRPLPERVLYGTEESLESDCAASGRFVTYDLEGTFGGEGFRDTATTKHRMTALDTWTPERQEGATGCASAHYFDSRGDGLFANAFYEQGVRFLDVSNPRDIRQVGWWRPADANTWAAYWRGNVVVVADFTRGVEILRFKGSTRSRSVRAPVATPAGAPRFDRRYLGGLCPLV